MKLLKYLSTKNKIDPPIMMKEVFDLFPPLLDGIRSYNIFYLLSLLCNFSLNSIKEPWKWVSRKRVKSKIGFRISSGKAHWSTEGFQTNWIKVLLYVFNVKILSAILLNQQYSWQCCQQYCFAITPGVMRTPSAFHQG